MACTKMPIAQTAAISDLLPLKPKGQGKGHDLNWHISNVFNVNLVAIFLQQKRMSVYVMGFLQTRL